MKCEIQALTMDQVSRNPALLPRTCRVTKVRGKATGKILKLGAVGVGRNKIPFSYLTQAEILEFNSHYFSQQLKAQIRENTADFYLIRL